MMNWYEKPLIKGQFPKNGDHFHVLGVMNSWLCETFVHLIKNTQSNFCELTGQRSLLPIYLIFQSSVCCTVCLTC